MADILHDLAGAYEGQERYAEAESLYKRAQAIREKSLDPDNSDLGAAPHNLARLHFLQGQWEQADAYWRRSTDLIVRRTFREANNIGRALTRAQAPAQRTRDLFAGLIKANHRIALALPAQTPKLTADMFLAAQWAHNSETAATISQMAARQATGDGALARLVRERQDLVADWQTREKLLMAAMMQPPEKRDSTIEQEQRALLTAMETRIAEIDRRLRTEFADYAALASPAPLSIADAQAELRADEALVLLLNTPQLQPTPEESLHLGGNEDGCALGALGTRRCSTSTRGHCAALRARRAGSLECAGYALSVAFQPHVWEAVTLRCCALPCALQRHIR